MRFSLKYGGKIGLYFLESAIFVYLTIYTSMINCNEKVICAIEKHLNQLLLYWCLDYKLSTLVGSVQKGIYLVLNKVPNFGENVLDYH